MYLSIALETNASEVRSRISSHADALKQSLAAQEATFKGLEEQGGGNITGAMEAEHARLEGMHDEELSAFAEQQLQVSGRVKHNTRTHTHTHTHTQYRYINENTSCHQYATGCVYQLAQEQARVYADWHSTAGISLQTAEDDVSALLDALEARLNTSLESSDSLKSTLEGLAAESDGERGAD